MFYCYLFLLYLFLLNHQILAQLPKETPQKLKDLSIELQELLILNQGEPSIQELYQMAVQKNAFDQEKFEQLQKHSNQQAWLPILDIGMGLNQDFDDEKQKKYAPLESGNMGQKELLNRNQYGDGYQMNIDIKWDFSELIFNPQEVSIARENRYTMREKNKLLEDLTVVYFDRLKVKIKLLDQNLSVDDRLALKIKLLELSAQIDAYTQGALSRGISP